MNIQYSKWNLRWVIIAVFVLLPTMLFSFQKSLAVTSLAAVGQPKENAFGQTYIIGQSISFPVAFTHIYQIAHNPVRNQLYVMGDSNKLFQINLTTGTATEISNLPSLLGYEIAVSMDGQRAFLRTQAPAKVYIYNTSNWSVIHSFDSNVTGFLEVDGRLFAFGSNTVEVFNSQTGVFIESVLIPTGSGFGDSDIVVSPDHQTLYFHGTTTLHKLDISTTPVSHTFSAVVGNNLDDLAISPDGSYLTLSQYPSNSIYRYHASNFTLMDSLAANPNEYLRSITFTSEALVGSYSYSGSPVIRAFDMVSGSEFRNFASSFTTQLAVSDLESIDNGRVAVGVLDSSWPKVLILKPADYSVALPFILYDYCNGPYTDNFSNPQSGWPRGTSGNISFDYLNGEYQLYHGDGDRWFGVTRGDRFGADDDDQYVEIDSRILNGQDGVVGIVWGLNETWTDFYTFEVWPNEQYWFIFHFNSGTGWVLQTYGPSSSINRTGVNRLMMHGTPTSQYQFLVNNYQHIVTHPGVMGRVGFSASSFVGGTDFRYDNYAFQSEGCHPTELIPSSIQFGPFDVAERAQQINKVLPITRP